MASSYRGTSYWDTSRESNMIVLDMEDLSLVSEGHDQCEECGRDMSEDCHGYCNDEWRDTD